ncbi:hypothetical protein ACLI4Z_02205 [Natrialbaceae archaeon A-arb3/5]
MTIDNADTTEYEVDFRVEWNDELVHDQTYSLDARKDNESQMPGKYIERTWPNSPGQFAIQARLNGGEWKTIEPADEGNPDCLSVRVRIYSVGLRFQTFTQESECSTEAIKEVKETYRNSS